MGLNSAQLKLLQLEAAWGRKGMKLWASSRKRVPLSKFGEATKPSSNSKTQPVSQSRQARSIKDSERRANNKMGPHNTCWGDPVQVIEF